MKHRFAVLLRLIDVNDGNRVDVGVIVVVVVSVLFFIVNGVNVVVIRSV